MPDFESFWTNNLESFSINIISESFFFVLGILLSVWLIPYYTIRLLKRQNKKYLKQKISFAIEEVCDFFNSMPHQFRPNDNICAIYCSNIRHTDLDDFVAMLKPDLFAPIAFEIMIKNLLQAIQDMNSEGRHELIESEIQRLVKLRDSLENMVGVHFNALESDVINEISQLCLDIRIIVRKHAADAIAEELMGQKEGIFGSRHLRTVYENAFSLLKRLVSEDGFSKKQSIN